MPDLPDGGEGLPVRPVGALVEPQRAEEAGGAASPPEEGGPGMSEEKGCQVCHGTGQVPVTEVRQDPMTIQGKYVYRQVVTGWRPCPDCGKEEKP